jgi:hypothetical protein
MDRLKDFIIEHREAFENDVLPEGHLERFEKKLGKRRFLRKAGFAALAVAAAAGILLLLKAPHETPADARPPDAFFSCEAGEEIEALRRYYTMQMYDVQTQISDLYARKETPGSLELMEETERIVQTAFDFEADILPSLPCSDAGIQIIHQYYSRNLESLDFMLQQMNRTVHMDTNNQSNN